MARAHVLRKSLGVAGALLVCLPSLLTVLPPGLNAFWKLSIPVRETGFLIALPCLALAAWSAASWKSNLGARLLALLFLAAAALYAIPLVQAIRTASTLEQEFARRFGPAPTPPKGFLRARPLIWKDVLGGIPRGPSWPLAFAYSFPGDDTLRLDFYPAVKKNPAPCVVVIHGGGWDTGERGQFPELNTWLARAGYAVADIDYRLAPGHSFPAPIEDVAAALSVLKARARALGVDTTRFVLLGRSAGGQIALQAAYTLNDPAIKAVVGFYAPADMVFGYSLPGNPLILDSRKVMDQYLDGGCKESDAPCRAASPLEFATPDSPPTLLLHGRPDVLVSFQHTVHLERKLNELGVPHFSVDLPWSTHGYDYVFSGLGSQISLYFLERFLAVHVPLTENAR